MPNKKQPYLLHQIYSNEFSRLTKEDILELTVTRDGTIVVETRDDACELSYEEVVALNHCLNEFITQVHQKQSKKQAS